MVSRVGHNLLPFLLRYVVLSSTNGLLTKILNLHHEVIMVLGLGRRHIPLEEKNYTKTETLKKHYNIDNSCLSYSISPLTNDYSFNSIGDGR